MTLFEEIIANEMYSTLLNKLPEDERPVVIESLKKFVDVFESKVLKPAKTVKRHTS